MILMNSPYSGCVGMNTALRAYSSAVTRPLPGAQERASHRRNALTGRRRRLWRSRLS
jgi:hypothetical protein